MVVEWAGRAKVPAPLLPKSTGWASGTVKPSRRLKKVDRARGAGLTNVNEKQKKGELALGEVVRRSLGRAIASVRRMVRVPTSAPRSR